MTPISIGYSLLATTYKIFERTIHNNILVGTVFVLNQSSLYIYLPVKNVYNGLVINLKCRSHDANDVITYQLKYRNIKLD